MILLAVVKIFLVLRWAAFGKEMVVWEADSFTEEATSNCYI